MRKPRLSFDFSEPKTSHLTYVHTSFANHWPAMNLEERRKILENAHETATFSGVDLLAFCILPRGIHLLLEVPPKLKLNREEMWKRFLKIANPVAVEREEKLLAEGGGDTWKRLESRFGDVSSFMKRVKQITTRRYHRHHGTKGNLWTERFGQTGIQKGHPARVITAWIEHGVVRDNPRTSVEKERLTSFGAAKAGDEAARAGLTKIFSESGETVTWREVSAEYRDFLKEDSPPWVAGDGRPKTYGLNRQKMLLAHISAFQEGLIIGSREWVENLFERNRDFFGPKRKTGARRIAGLADPLLWTIRQKPPLVSKQAALPAAIL